jgi:uncharacterized protein (DUF433 family)
MPTTLFIPTAQAAFIAGLTDRQMNRVVDEHLVPEPLFEQRGSSRLFTRLGAAFAKFYFETEDQLLASARRQVLDELNNRVAQLPTKNQVLALMLLDSTSWKVERKHVEVDVLPFLQDAFHRAEEVDQADTLVTTDPEVMGGLPVFAGTRVPVDTVLATLTAGIVLDRLKTSYPFLTEAHIRSAKVYEAVHPRRGRPRRIADVNPEFAPRSTQLVRRAAGT